MRKKKYKSMLDESKVVSADDEGALYELFGYTPEMALEDMGEMQKGNKPKQREYGYIKNIEDNPLRFFNLPKSAVYLYITGENTWFYYEALKAFEKGLRDPKIKEFLKDNNVSVTSLIVKSRRDYLDAVQEVDDILIGKAKKESKNKNKSKAKKKKVAEIG